MDVFQPALATHNATALDLFAGTGIVSKTLRQNGVCVTSNDWQRYSYALATASLFNFDEDRLSEITVQMNSIKPIAHRFVEEFCEGGRGQRLYFSAANGGKIAAVREEIRKLHDAQEISEREQWYLVACLLEAADKVANTASVYGAFLKQIKKSASVDLNVRALEIGTGPDGNVLCEDALDIASSRVDCDPFDLVYIDPPYNHRQYSANYHLLETIALWDIDAFEPRGKTGLRPADQQASPFCRSQAVESAMAAVIAIPSRMCVISYNNEGLLPKETLEGLVAQHFSSVQTIEVPYTRYKADKSNARRYKSDMTHEWIVVGRAG